MKKYLSLGLLLAFSTTLVAWREYDIIKGVDLTGRTNVTAALLNQLVDAATINTNKGLVVNSSTRPNVTDNPRYTNFLWFDRSTVTLKYYVGIGDSDTNWLAAIGASSITGTNIADYSITANKLATNSVLEYAISAGAVTSTKINDGQVTLGKIGPAAVTNGNLGFAAVTYDKIAAGTIQTTNLADSLVTSNKLAADSVNTVKILDGTVGSADLANNAVTSGKIAADAVYGTNVVTGTLGTNNFSTNVVFSFIKAWGVVNSTGTLLKGHNVSVSTYSVAGNYRIQFMGSYAPSSTNYCVSGTAVEDTGGRVLTISTNRSDGFDVRIRSLVPVTEAAPFNFMVMDY